MPRFDGNIRLAESAIFWFGEVTPSTNAVDVRIGYNDTQLFVRVTTFDRRIWYDTTPTAETFAAWDGVTLYLHTEAASDELTSTSYRFDAQMTWWEPRDTFQVAYTGSPGEWTQADLAFTTAADWRSENAPNNQEDDRGWVIEYRIPFESLGQVDAPAKGTRWRVGAAVHDRDALDLPPEADQTWPESLLEQHPNSWGELRFGASTYAPPAAISTSPIFIREGLEGIVIPDSAVGGSTNCGSGYDYWTTWGNQNYGEYEYFNVQNQQDVADWPCFSKYYVTFPLDSLPAARVVISAALRLHHFGNAGEGWEPGPQPSLIQVFTVDAPWQEETITWNNAPLARENVAARWVDPVDEYPGLPGIPYDWDVSAAVAEAYTEGSDLQLAIYEADSAYHSGKYFHSSEEEEYNAEGRPTLIVTLGYRTPDLELIAMPQNGDEGDTIAFTLHVTGTNNALTLTNTIPEGLGMPTDLSVVGSSVSPVYDPATHRLTWQDQPADGEKVTVHYTTQIGTDKTETLKNTVYLTEASGLSTTESISLLANGVRCYLPLVSRTY